MPDKLSDEAASASVNAVCALLAGGKFRIYSGRRPAGPDAPIGGAVLLAQLTFGSPAFGSAVGGVATAYALTPDSKTPATGEATWLRAVKASGAPVFDGSVGTSGCDLNLDSTTIFQDSRLVITGFNFRAAKA